MRKQLIPAVAVLFAACSPLASADDQKSGLQPGEKAGAFQVFDCTGGQKGSKLCYR